MSNDNIDLLCKVNVLCCIRHTLLKKSLFSNIDPAIDEANVSIKVIKDYHNKEVHPVRVSHTR